MDTLDLSSATQLRLISLRLIYCVVLRITNEKSLWLAVMVSRKLRQLSGINGVPSYNVFTIHYAFTMETKYLVGFVASQIVKRFICVAIKGERTRL